MILFIRSFYCLFLFLFTFASYAQTINGKVINSSGLPLEFVTVSLKSGGTVIFAAVTDRLGDYHFKGVKGSKNYSLEFSVVGYKTADTTIVFNKEIDLIQILQIDRNQLKEVAIVSKKKLFERKIDRFVFNVEDNINTIGVNGLDLLEKTPLVRADENGIKIVGKSGLSLMVDGKLLHLNGGALIEFLKTINGESVSKIEVITNPSAQYEASGDSGMINIITRKTKAIGYVATVGAGLSRNTYSTFSQNASLNYNLDKLLLFGTFSAARGANGPINRYDRFYETQTWHQDLIKKDQSHFFRGNVGFEYLITKNTTLGASYSGTNSKPNSTQNGQASILNNTTRLLDSIVSTYNDGQIAFKTNTANFHVNHNLDSLGKKMVFDADYFEDDSYSVNNSKNINTLPDGSLASEPSIYQSTKDLMTKGYSFNLEFNIPHKKGALIFGAKSSFVKNNNEVSLNTILVNFPADAAFSTNLFEFRENIQAVFASYGTSFGKWSFQGGLRSEATQLKALSPKISLINKKSYISLFPTVYLTYKMNEKDMLSMSYGRRINRPYYQSFNPARVYYDRYNYVTGNPDANPTFTNNFEITNTYNNNLVTYLSYSYSNNIFSGVNIVENGTNTAHTEYSNSLSIKNFVLDNSYTFSTLKWLESMNEFSLYYAKSTSSLASVTPASGFGADYRMMNSIYFNSKRTLVAGADFSYVFPSVAANSHYGRYHYFDLRGSYMAFNKKLQFTVAVSDIFKSKYVNIETTTNNIKMVVEANNDSRRVLVNVKYSFGNFKMKKGSGHSVSGSELGRSGG